MAEKQDEIQTITVNLLNKEFTFRAPESGIEKLRQSATYLNEKMLEINYGGKAQGFERVVVVAAINICAELIENQSKEINKRQIHQRLEKLQQRIEAVLNTDTEEQLELSLN